MIVEFGISTNKNLTFADVGVGQLFLDGGYIWLKAKSVDGLTNIAIPVIDNENLCPSDFRYEYRTENYKIDKIFNSYSIAIKEY